MLTKAVPLIRRSPTLKKPSKNYRALGLIAPIWLSLLLGGEIRAIEDGGAPEGCERTENMLADTDFRSLSNADASPAWRYSQHAGDRSFSLSAEDDVMTIARTGSEPWMLLTQMLRVSPEPQSTMYFSAEMKADLTASPKLHGFDHIGGLWLRLGNTRAAVADHDPNIGSWDWQLVSVARPIPEGVTKIEAGFVHQAGGEMSIRSPSLFLETCSG